MNECSLVGVAQQRKSGIADEVHGGFMTSDIQQHKKCHQFVGGHFVAGFFGGDQARQHVVAQIFATIFDDGSEIRN